jgi:methylase of polypeptide subunit release factors
MTQLLEKAFDRASQLPDEDQDTLAERLLAEIESEKRWEELFANSQEELGKLADKALAEHRRGETQRMDQSRL